MINNLSEKDAAELEFWTRKYNEGLATWRNRDYQRALSYFPKLKNESGNGLDLGCGIISIFEGTGLTVTAIDPLLEEYLNVYKIPENNTVEGVLYQPGYGDGESLPYCDDFFDFIMCLNVIDHTEHHKLMISEIGRVLKPEGKLYFEVNFDPALGAPLHVKQWTIDTIREEVPFFMQRGIIDYIDCYDKYQFWGEFINKEGAKF